MTQNAEVISNPEEESLDAETYQGMAGTIIGMAAYMFLVVPTLTLTVVGVMNLTHLSILMTTIADGTDR